MSRGTVTCRRACPVSAVPLVLTAGMVGSVFSIADFALPEFPSSSSPMGPDAAVGRVALPRLRSSVIAAPLHCDIGGAFGPVIVTPRQVLSQL